MTPFTYGESPSEGWWRPHEPSARSHPIKERFSWRVVGYFELWANLQCSQRGLPPLPGARL